MKSIITTLICLILFSCTHKNSSKNTTNTPTISTSDSLATQSKAKELSQLKDISDLKMLFIDASPRKVIDLFGQPDIKRESPSGNNGYYVYYDMVKENNVIKNLVISYHFNDYDASDSGIKDVKAVNDGESVVLTNGFSAVTITVKKPDGFVSQYHDVDNQINQIGLFVKGIDTTKIPAHLTNDLKYLAGDTSQKREVKFYTDANSKIILIKIVFPIGNGDFSITGYYFIDGKLKFKIDGDKQRGLLTCQSYILNDRVVKYIRGDDVFSKIPSGDIENQTYDENSEPYELLNQITNQ
jgi:hypothetical protein